MSVEERLLLGEIGIEGEFEIAITNPLTGRLYQHVKSKNVITNGMYEYLRMLQWHMLRRGYDLGQQCYCGLPYNYGTDGAPFGPVVRKIVLSNGTLTESASRRVIDGEIVAYGNESMAVTTDTKQGIFTPGESYAVQNKIVRRWDFPSDKGNGTFSKINLVNTYKGGYFDVVGLGEYLGDLLYIYVFGRYVYYFPVNSYNAKKYLPVEQDTPATMFVGEVYLGGNMNAYNRIRFSEDGEIFMTAGSSGFDLHDAQTGEKTFTANSSNMRVEDGTEQGAPIGHQMWPGGNYGSCAFLYKGKAYWYRHDGSYPGFYEANFSTLRVTKLAEYAEELQSVGDSYLRVVVKGNNIYFHHPTTYAVYKIDGNALEQGSLSIEMVVPYARLYDGEGILFDVIEGDCIKFFTSGRSYVSSGVTYMNASSGIVKVPIVDSPGTGANASQLELMAEKLLPSPVTKDNMPMYVSYALNLV